MRLHSVVRVMGFLALTPICGGCAEDSADDAAMAGSSAFDVASAGCPGGADTCIPAAVQAVLESKCFACHGEPIMNFAPMSLTTQQAFQGMHAAAQEPNYVRAAVRIRNEQTPMPPSRWPQLTADERDVLLDWLDSGAPSGP